MTPKVPPGTCLLCRAPVTKRKALKHAMECLQASGWPTGKKPSLLIMIQGLHKKSYWLVVLARHDARLGDLDQLIRDVWVECCGHLSSFEIDGVLYDSDDDMCSTGAMEVPLSDLVSPGSTFIYDYDFGSVTSLALKVIGETPIAPLKDPLCLIARNNRPTIPCDLCGGEAAFTLGDIYEENPRYYCRECLLSTDYDPYCVGIISNSPRDGVCGYVEDAITALHWYPPGWSADEIVPEELSEIPGMTAFDDEAEVEVAIYTIIQDIGPDIDAFVEAEKAAYGEEAGAMAGDTVVAFCTFMLLAYGVKIDAWDAPSVQECLIEHLSQNPIYPEDWPMNAVPILCRFLTHMEASGHLTNASELIAVLKEAEPAFQKAATSPEKVQAIFKLILMKAEEAGVNTNDMNAFFNFAVRELVEMAGVDLDNEEVQKELSNLLEGGILEVDAEDLRVAMILARCEDFCKRFPDNTILEHCRRIVKDLFDHPAAPLARGDAVLWSAAIVYAACQDEDLIRPGRGAPPLGQEISSFFGVERASIRNKVRAMRAFLPD
jgi:hypothetical protein